MCRTGYRQVPFLRSSRPGFTDLGSCLMHGSHPCVFVTQSYKTGKQALSR